jgi:SH3-like domain-containing protein
MKQKTSVVAYLVLCLLCFTHSTAADTPVRGAVTNLPLPRFVSLKASEGNVRRGPSLDHRIDWILKHRNTPLQVVAEYGHWRKVLDFEGAGGWIHYALLSGSRMVIVRDELLDLKQQPKTESLSKAQLQQNVIARVSACESKWCKITAGGYKGWVQKTALWGVSSDDIFD